MKKLLLALTATSFFFSCEKNKNSPIVDNDNISVSVIGQKLEDLDNVYDLAE